MTDEYIFETTVLVQDPQHDVLWKGDDDTVRFVSANNTLSDSYMTCENGENSTQFFSVLETSTETILNDMSQVGIDVSGVGDFALVEEEGEEEDTQISDTAQITENQDVVLYHVSESDNLYGVQLAHDEDGNLQKYQFQVRQNDEGQFETIPGTIQIVPLDTDGILLEGNTQPVELRDEILVLTKQEEIQEGTLRESLQGSQEELYEQQEEEFFEQQEELYEQETGFHNVDIKTEDTKEGILEKTLKGNQPYVYTTHMTEEVDQYLNTESNNEEEEESDIVSQGSEEEHLIPYEQLYLSTGEEFNEVEEETTESLEEPDTNMIPRMEIIEEAHNEDEMELYIPEDEEMYSAPSEDSDEEYANGIHITGDEELQDIEHVIITEEKNMVEVGNNIIHVQEILDNSSNLKPTEKLCITSIEKENYTVSSRPQKINPRSILKSSVLANAERQIEERKPRKKVSQQARQFQNYIAQTKIIQAPVRQVRLPRKQKIEPLEKSGEEIVIQEVVVSSNGFIETREDGVIRERKPLIPTECIYLSDSDDETKSKKRKRKAKKQIQIVISDSEDDVLIENKDPDEETKNNNNKSEGDGENICHKCQNSFPSIGSLKTHMQYHSFEDSNVLKTKNQTVRPFDFKKYKCPECCETFRNNLLLSKHTSLHNDRAKIECTLCKKLFTDRGQLLTHKRSHVKEQMFKVTNVTKVSPRKSRRISSVERTSFKCPDCARVFSTNLLLQSHLKTHRRFTCQTCLKVFNSKVIFDTHLHKDCVKSPRKRYVSPKKKRVTRTSLLPRSSTSLARSSVTTKPSIKTETQPKLTIVPRPSTLSKIREAPRVNTKQPNEMKLPKSNLLPRKILKSNEQSTRIKCDSCDLEFISYTVLFKHKVAVHGLETPDKKALNDGKKKRGEHSGVPANRRLANAFAGLKHKLKD